VFDHLIDNFCSKLDIMDQTRCLTHKNIGDVGTIYTQYIMPACLICPASGAGSPKERNAALCFQSNIWVNNSG